MREGDDESSSPTRSERLQPIIGPVKPGSARLNALEVASVLDFWRQSVGCRAHWGRPKLAFPTEGECIVEHHTSHIRPILTRSLVQPALSYRYCSLQSVLIPSRSAHTVLTSEPVFTSYPTFLSNFATILQRPCTHDSTLRIRFRCLSGLYLFSRKCPSLDPLLELSSRLSELLLSPSDPSLWPHVNRSP